MTAGMANLGQPKRPAASPADKDNANPAKRVDGEKSIIKKEDLTI